MRNELREETQARRLRAQLEVEHLKAALSAQKSMLSTYAAAGRGRNNKDWRAAGISADLAIIPDAEILNARARQMVRDSWVARSAVASFVRNVIGCGIIPIPQARDAKGELLPAVNKRLLGLFWAWANDKQWCDLEKEQTHWQMQALAEQERATVGEAFWVWNYEPHLTQTSLPRVDRSKPIGLKIQAFEPEQLDTTIVSFNGNEVRGGLEINGRGVVVAYHVFTRNPNDYLSRQNLTSVRLPAERVLHYFRKERVRQKRGETPLAPVLQDMRDLSRYKDAALWRAIMESCIGLTVKRQAGTGGPGGSFQGIMPRMSGDNGATPSGAPTADFMPGMVADPGAGVEFEAFTPQAPGNQYEPFTRQTLRGVGAGLRISYGQLSRDFTQGTYSGQRQEMLEDRKEFEPLQELAAHNLVLLVYRLFVALAFSEGRVEGVDDFASDPMRYTAAEFIAPPTPVLDPSIEAKYVETMIKLRLISREEVCHSLRGMRFSDILDKIAQEAKDAQTRGITFDENDTERTAKQEIVKAFIADGTVADVIANATKIPDLVDQAGLPVNPDYKDPWLPVIADNGQKVSGAVVKDAEGDVVGGDTLPGSAPAGTAKEPGKGEQNNQNGGNAAGGEANGAGESPKNGTRAGMQRRKSLTVGADVVPAEVPNYRAVTGDSPLTCGACRFFVSGKCTAYEFVANPAFVCDAFEAPAPLEDPATAGRGRRIVETPPLADGQRPMDDPRGQFLDRGERGLQ